MRTGTLDTPRGHRSPHVRQTIRRSNKRWGWVCKPRTEILEETSPASALISCFRPPEVGEIMLLLKPPGLWHCAAAAPAHWYNDRAAGNLSLIGAAGAFSGQRPDCGPRHQESLLFTYTLGLLGGDQTLSGLQGRTRGNGASRGWRGWRRNSRSELRVRTAVRTSLL